MFKLFAFGFFAILAISASAHGMAHLRTDYEEAAAVVQKMQNTINFAIERELRNFDEAWKKLESFFEEVYSVHNEMIDEYSKNALQTLIDLQSEADNLEVDITECLAGKETQINEEGPKLMTAVTKCVQFGQQSVVVLREAMRSEFFKVRSEGIYIEIEMKQCESSECFDGVIAKATEFEPVADNEITILAKVPINGVNSLREEVAYCFLLPQVGFVETLGKIADDAKTCAEEKFP